MGGADRIRVEGISERTIPIRVVRLAPDPEVSDTSSQRSALTLFSPLPDDPPDALDLARLDPDDAVRRAHYQPFRDWGSDWLFFPQLAYDSTRGLVFGGTVERTAYGFGLDPLSSVMKFAGAWSTGTSRPRLEYSADLRTRSLARGLLYLGYSGMDSVKYFGSGNDTPRDPTLASTGYYDVRQEQLIANALLELRLIGPLRGRFGPMFKYASSVQQSGILASAPAGTGGTSLASLVAGLALNERGGTFPSRRGISFEVTGRYTPAIFGNSAAFTKLRGEVAGSIGGRIVTDVLLDLRVAGERNWGAYPWFEAAFIGGSAYRAPLDPTGTSSGNLLRGYDLNRFAGDASVVTNTELHVAIGRYNGLLPLRYGVVALADVGRVFVGGQSSSRWHAGYGGGLWAGMFAAGQQFQLVSALKATVVRSDEGTSFYLASGFAF